MQLVCIVTQSYKKNLYSTLEWHLCGMKLPEKFLIPTRSETKSSKNAPKHPENYEALLSCLKMFDRPFFTVLHPPISNTMSKPCLHNQNLEAWPR